ncbi:hypothetical protein [Paraburkholderia sp. BCC1886]|uniref:hypothetical protein n=1 Tax=Paraburkholderia sp. BCC1886 TaxID=2562670 RepID=UPI00118356C8|nr:hypothetical protein [Paraburkholderia sp. BCC1886]
MNLIEFIFKLVWSAWPFVKEMVLEGKSLREAFRANRRRAIFSIAVMASITFNVLNIWSDIRLVTLLDKYVQLQNAYDHLSKQKQLPQDTRGEPDAEDDDAEPTVPASASAVQPASDAATNAQLENYQGLESLFGAKPVKH